MDNPTPEDSALCKCHKHSVGFCTDCTEETTKECTCIDERDTYIKELEKAVCFLADLYQKNYDTFHTEVLKTISVSNPNRREMTKEEEYGLMNITTIQGLRGRFAVEKLAKLRKNGSIDLDLIIQKISNGK